MVAERARALERRKAERRSGAAAGGGRRGGDEEVDGEGEPQQEEEEPRGVLPQPATAGEGGSCWASPRRRLGISSHGAPGEGPRS